MIITYPWHGTQAAVQYGPMIVWWVYSSGGAVVSASNLMDAEQCIKIAYDDSGNTLGLKNITPVSAGGTQLDWRQVLKRVYDASTSKLRIGVI